MAKRKYSQKNYANKRRKYSTRKRFRRRYKRSLYSLPLTGFAKSKLVRLRYAEEIVFNPATAGISSYVFSANGMYDPNITGTGHQPSGFDQNMLFYDHYTVISSKCSVKYFDDAGTAAIPAYFDVILTDAGTTASSFANVNDFIESRFAHGTTMKAVGAPFNYNSVNPWRRTMFNAKRFFHKKAIVGASQYRGDASANPAEQAYYEVICAAINGNDPAPVNLLVVIDFIAVLTEPKNVAQS